MGCLFCLPHELYAIKARSNQNLWLQILHSYDNRHTYLFIENILKVVYNTTSLLLQATLQGRMVNNAVTVVTLHVELSLR